MLNVAAIDLFYGASHCLRGVSLQAEPGKVTTVLGRNGVGKSSLLRAIMGLERVRSGSITWEGRDITTLAASERARAGISYVPQGREIFPFLTVQENLQTALAAAPRGAKVEGAIFDLFPILRQFLRPRTLRPAVTADPRRADGGHPAFRHQGHRARHSPPVAGSRHGRRAGGAVLRLRARTGGQHRRDGARRGRDGRPRRVAR